MAFKISVNADSLKGIEPVPAGLYTVRFVGFKPKAAAIKPGETKFGSVQLNIEVQIVGRPDLDLGNGKPRSIFYGMNTKMEGFINDIVHSFGLEMEDQLSDSPYIPGDWTSDSDFDPEKPETWKYVGPLTGKTAEWELGVGEYNGKPKQLVKRVICKVPDCASRFPAIRHSTQIDK